jgi:hypothetical protein
MEKRICHHIELSGSLFKAKAIYETIVQRNNIQPHFHSLW